VWVDVVIFMDRLMRGVFWGDRFQWCCGCLIYQVRGCFFVEFDSCVRQAVCGLLIIAVDEIL
jgi:hypothetical protein